MFMAAKRMARQYGQIGLAEPDDIIQSAMVKLLKKDDGRKPTLGWLYRAVHSSAMDAGRSASRDKQMICNESSDDPRLVCERADQCSCLRFHGGYIVREESCEIDLMPRLKNMLEKLSKPLKQVLVLYSEGYSYQEIARLTNTNIGTVRSRLHYARRRAQDLLGDMA
jgi:RNA polymerase sigma-70 factor (ECF subfamily)